MARPAKRDPTDQEWQAIEADWRSNELAYRPLAEKHGITVAQLRTRFESIPRNHGLKREIVRSIASGEAAPAVRKRLDAAIVDAAIADSVVLGNAATGHATIIRRIKEASDSAPLSLLPGLAQGLQRATDGFIRSRDLDGPTGDADTLLQRLSGQRFEPKA
jgi:hypothetical protein